MLRVQVRIEMGRGLQDLARRGQETFRQALRRWLETGVRLLESSIKQEITSQRLVDTGRLRASVTGSIREALGAVVVVGSGVKYARIHEYGGTIRPVRARALAVPINEQARRASRLLTAGGQTLRSVQGLVPIRVGSEVYLLSPGRVAGHNRTSGAAWVLKRSVAIRPKHYVRQGVLQARGALARALGEAMQWALQRLARRG